RRWCRGRTCSRDGPADRVHHDAAPASSGGEPSALCGVVRACRPEQDGLVASPIGFGCKYRRVHRWARHSSQNVHQPRLLQDPRSGVDPRRAPGCSRQSGRIQPRRRRRSQQRQHALLHERARPAEERQRQQQRQHRGRVGGRECGRSWWRREDAVIG
ncbi:unnamed protein product, partial [Ectocarpus sp. 12 AP-2014]